MNLVEASKQTWSAGSPPTLEQIDSGSLQRIATAVEVVANNYIALINERNFWRGRAVENQKKCEELVRSYRALKANHTRQKSKLKK